MVSNKNKVKIALLTKTIKASWRRSVESLLTIGKCLHELKKILDRPAYLQHLADALSMSEMHAHRIEHLYLKFHDKKSLEVLSSKPSVLYLLASAVDSKKIDSLARGGKVLVGNKYKVLSQFTISDVRLLQEAVKSTLNKDNDDDQEDEDRDLERAAYAHRRLSTLIEEISDWSEDLIRFQKSNIKINNKDLVKRYIKETIQCLRTLENLLS